MPRWNPDYIPTSCRFAEYLESRLRHEGRFTGVEFSTVHKRQVPQRRALLAMEEQIAQGLLVPEEARQKHIVTLTPHRAIEVVLNDNFVEHWWTSRAAPCRNAYLRLHHWLDVAQDVPHLGRATTPGLETGFEEHAFELSARYPLQVLTLQSQLHYWRDFPWNTQDVDSGSDRLDPGALTPVKLATHVRNQLADRFPDGYHAGVLYSTVKAVGVGPVEDLFGVAAGVLALVS